MHALKYTLTFQPLSVCVPDVEVFEDLRVEIINLSRHIQNIANTIYGTEIAAHNVRYMYIIGY